MTDAPPDDPVVAALLTAVGLKDVARAGWVRRGVPQPESVAAHSWGVAWLALVLAPPHLDRARLLTYAVLHDLAEVTVGDLTPHDGVSAVDKRAREEAAMVALCASLPSHLLDAWRAYEDRADDEARFVHQLDKLDMAVQAAAYAARGAEGMAEFVASARARVGDDGLRAVLDGLPRAR